MYDHKYLNVFEARTYAPRLIEKLAEVKKPYLGTHSFSLLPLNNSDVDNTYDTYLTSTETKSLFHSHMTRAYLYPKIMENLKRERAKQKPILVSPLNLQYAHGQDMVTIRHLTANGLKFIITHSNEGLAGLDYYLDYYYLFITAANFDLSIIHGALVNAILHSGNDQHRTDELLRQFLQRFNEFVQLGPDLIKLYYEKIKKNRKTLGTSKGHPNMYTDF